MKTLMLLSALLSVTAQASALNIWSCSGKDIRVDVTLELVSQNGVVEGGVQTKFLTVRDLKGVVQDRVEVKSNGVAQSVQSKVKASYSGKTPTSKVDLAIWKTFNENGGYLSQLVFSNAGGITLTSLSCLLTRSADSAR